MKDDTIKTSVCGLIISALIIGLAIPKTSISTDVVLFAALLTTFLYMVLPKNKP